MRLCLSTLAVLSIAILAACDRRANDAASEPAQSVATSTAPEDSAYAKDADDAKAIRELFDSGSGWAIRVEWPAAVERYPRLAEALRDSIGAARREIMKYALPDTDGPPCGPDSAPEGCGELQAPIETQMIWRIAIETPRYVAVSMEGYTYTGGRDRVPLHETLHYDVERDQLLEVVDLMQHRSGWEALSAIIRQELYRRAEESLADVPPETVEEQRRLARERIDEGTEPRHDKLGLFVPHAGPDGRVAELTFIFLPGQVGPSWEGTHGIDVPLSSIVEHLSVLWREPLTGERL